MGIFDYFRSPKPTTASLAKERLQIIVARERSSLAGPDYLPALHREILEVVRKFANVDEEAVQIKLDRDGNCEVLELNITLPDS